MRTNSKMRALSFFSDVRGVELVLLYCYASATYANGRRKTSGTIGHFRSMVINLYLRFPGMTTGMQVL